jgi:hypothetical protein
MTESLYRMGPRWKVGNPCAPSADDQSFMGEVLALTTARDMANQDRKSPVAVWDMEDSRIVRLLICGQEFVCA